jgi:two-component system sensor histidine kinase TctE
VSTPARSNSVLSDLLATRESPARSALKRPTPTGAPGKPSRAHRRAPAAHEQRSLFGEILDWMFAPLMLLWPLSVAITFVVARSLADAPFDQALIDRTAVLREQLLIVEPGGNPRLPQIVEKLLKLNEGESIAVQVVSGAGEVLAGDVDLPRPGIYDFPTPGRTRLRNAVWRGDEVRIAYTYVSADSAAPGDQATLIQVAETLDTRARLANEIIRGVLFPQFLILPLAIGLVWFGLSRGLSPLKALQEGIRQRRQDDLSPIDTRSAPEELAPLVDAFNDLLNRQSKSLQSQTRFIADAAHQLKTPLAGLRTQAELALRTTDPQDLRRSLEQIADSASRSAHMVSQLLALTRMEHLREATRLEALDLAPLVRSVMVDFYENANERSIELSYDADDTPAPVAGHPVLLRELIANLLDNAIRYSPDGGHIAVEVRGNIHGEVELVVEDDGVGIAPDDRPRIFDRFYRVLGTNVEGSGLGLSIVNEIAMQHGATVQVSDGLLWDKHRGAGTGSRFTVKFRTLIDELL